MKRLRISVPVFIVILLAAGAHSVAAQENRGAWLSRNELVTHAALTAAIDSLANNNFNTIYVNCWSRGYPLWPSAAYQKETGMLIDPTFVGRDVLREAIAEGHRRGMSVEAWFEYGFVGGYTGWYPGTSGKGKIFDIHPAWVASQQGGIEKDNSNFYWMTQTRPEVQAFLLSLVTDVAKNYDIDGIELDRVRYAGNVYGYDAYTDSVYRAEHAGTPPPTTVSDTSWMRWRADILNRFMRAAYDSIKVYNPNIHVTNAPGFYSTSTYESYIDNLQDWWQWVRTGSVDAVQVQMYISDSTSLGASLDYLSKNVAPYSKIIPALAVAPGGNQLSTTAISKLIAAAEKRGLHSIAWWYYGDLGTYWSFFRTSVYPTPAPLADRPAGWRVPGTIVNETDTSVSFSAGWALFDPTNTDYKGYTGGSQIADSAGSKWVDYSVDVPYTGWYELYAFQVPYPVRTTRAPYDLFDSTGTPTRLYVDQSNAKNRGWYKLGDLYCLAGHRRIVRLSNDSIGYQKSIDADAIMLVVNRKLSPDLVTVGVKSGNFKNPRPEDFRLGQNFPNPFNPSTTMSFTVPHRSEVDLGVYDLLGRRIATLMHGVVDAGEHTVRWDARGTASGMYLCRLVSGPKSEVRRMLLVK